SSPVAVVDFTLALTAEARTRSRHRYTTEGGVEVYLDLPRGTVLKEGDHLGADDHAQVLQVIARPEAVMTVKAQTEFDLLRAAYHLGNRHVPLELHPDYLRLSPDPVLAHLLEHLGAQIVYETVPFEPESGAYGHAHAH
ncbi:MAG: urease accessory protein UreE, partial [Cyanobacteria bacterium P01_G01_bin.38]